MAEFNGLKLAICAQATNAVIMIPTYAVVYWKVRQGSQFKFVMSVSAMLLVSAIGSLVNAYASW